MRNGNIPGQVKPVKLCVITQFYPPDYAATGQLIEELVTNLAKRGMQIQVFTGQPGYAFQKNFAPQIERFDRLSIRRSCTSRLWPQRIRGKALNGLLFCLRSGLHLFKIFRKKDVLLLTTAPPYLPLLGYLASTIFRLPYVCLLYDLYPDVAVELNVIPENHFLTLFWDFANRHIWRRAKALIVLSSTMKDRIAVKCPEVKEKISVIHNWANPNWIVPIEKQDNWFARKHDLLDRFIVLYSGNMGRCHDLDTIMETAIQLKDKPVQFVFIGGGAKRKSCLETVETYGLDNCLFLPYQDRDTIPYSLTACDLSLVSIGPGMEGLIAPSKFYGSLAAGRPIAAICEPHSYLRKVISEAGCGAAFATGEAKSLAKFILKLLADPDLTQQMGRAGRHYLELNFTPEVITEQYLQVLTSKDRSSFQEYNDEDEPSIKTIESPSSQKDKPDDIPEQVRFSSKLTKWLRS